MAEKVRVVFEAVEAQQNAFGAADQQLGDSIREMSNIARMMDDGALKGQGGESFRDAILTKLIPGMKRLQEKMQEMHREMGSVMDVARGVEGASKGRFTD